MTQPTQHTLIQQQRKALQDFVQVNAALAKIESQIDQSCALAEQQYQEVKLRLAVGMAEVQALPKLPPTGQAMVKTFSLPTFALPAALIGNDPMNMFQQCASEVNRLDIELKNMIHNFEIKRLRLSDSVAIELVQVPAGQFLFGEQKEKVELPEYFIGKTPVTTSQFLVFLNVTGYKADNYWSGNLTSKLNYPAVFVSWEDARAFCRWVSQLIQREIRLPSESEWEKASRGIDGRIYPWGNNKPTKQLANYSQMFSSGKLMPVGSYTPQGDSPYGCQDMAGNISEWCQNLDQQVSPHIIRGGAFSNPDSDLRCTYGRSGNPSYRNLNVGFRVVSPSIF